MKMESAVLYDSVFLLYNAVDALNARNQDHEDPVTIDPVPLSCEETEKYAAGPNITSLMREVKFQSLFSCQFSDFPRYIL